jgi:dGTPase
MFHSRLTHSLKVAQCARRLAERLKRRGGYTGAAARAVDMLDADAAEAAALAHDLGHPPFGHLAEQELNREAATFGGFEGNAQSFRILTLLALRWESHDGLDLTRVTLNGVMKYPWFRDEIDPAKSGKWNAYYSDRAEFEWVRAGCAGEERSLEAEIMDWADDITYAVHDMDDFYRAGLVPLERLCKRASEQEAFREYVNAKYTEKKQPERAAGICAGADMIFSRLLDFDVPYSGSRLERVSLRAAGSGMINRYLEGFGVENTSDGGAAVVISANLRNEVAALKELIWFYVIERPSLEILQRGQRHIISQLYLTYEKAALKDEHRLFPPLYVERLKAAPNDEAKKRAIVDLISSMTEATATEVYRRMTGVAGASISDPTGRLM